MEKQLKILLKHLAHNTCRYQSILELIVRNFAYFVQLCCSLDKNRTQNAFYGEFQGILSK